MIYLNHGATFILDDLVELAWVAWTVVVANVKQAPDGADNEYRQYH